MTSNLRARRLEGPAPLASADFSRVQAVFTDVDGTLTTHGQLRSQVIGALERLRAGGVKVVLVTGRPAGFGECWLRTLPVEGVIVENGGLYFTWDAKGRLRKTYARPEAQRVRDRQKLKREVALAMTKVPGVRLSTDSVYTEVDLALDYNEEVQLSTEVAETLCAWLQKRGVRAVRSSVHVNCWLGAFDKRWMVERYMKKQWGMTATAGDDRFVYAGDSLNDAPMFQAFSLSVGVANVLDVLDELEAQPRFVTRQREGEGFGELAAMILAARQAQR